MLQALDGFIEDKHGDAEYAQGIDFGNQHPDPVIAEGHGMAGGALCLPDTIPAKAQGNDVDEHVAGIGQQGQTVGQKTAGYFCGHYQAAKDDAKFELAGDRQRSSGVFRQFYLRGWVIWLHWG